MYAVIGDRICGVEVEEKSENYVLYVWYFVLVWYNTTRYLFFMYFNTNKKQKTMNNDGSTTTAAKVSTQSRPAAAEE